MLWAKCPTSDLVIDMWRYCTPPSSQISELCILQEDNGPALDQILANVSDVGQDLSHRWINNSQSVGNARTKVDRGRASVSNAGPDLIHAPDWFIIRGHQHGIPIKQSDISGIGTRLITGKSRRVWRHAGSARPNIWRPAPGGVRRRAHVLPSAPARPSSFRR